MKPLKTGLSALLLGVVLAPATAAGQAPVPPDNPAAIQYTEAYPTSHGPTDAQHQHHRSPEQALGGNNAERLEAQGTAGQETARVAAETAPETVGGGASDAGKGGAGSDSNGGSQGHGGNDPGTDQGDHETGSASTGSDTGLGDVAEQATGLNSSDGTGLLLPLALLGGIAWAVFYVTRRRRRAAQ